MILISLSPSIPFVVSTFGYPTFLRRTHKSSNRANPFPKQQRPRKTTNRVLSTQLRCAELTTRCEPVNASAALQLPRRSSVARAKRQVFRIFDLCPLTVEPLERGNKRERDQSHSTHPFCSQSHRSALPCDKPRCRSRCQLPLCTGFLRSLPRELLPFYNMVDPCCC